MNIELSSLSSDILASKILANEDGIASEAYVCVIKGARGVFGVGLPCNATWILRRVNERSNAA